MNTVVITARMMSERLPGKALIDIAGKPNLERIVQRFQECKEVQKIIVATTTLVADDEITKWCKKNKVECFRGAIDDVLERVLYASSGAEYVFRATTDCPFISPQLVDAAFRVVKQFNAHSGRVWGIPDRMIPVYGAAEFPYSFAALEFSYKNATKAQKEHPGAYFDENRLAFDCVYAVPPAVYNQTFYRPCRLELDTPEDLELVVAVYKALGDNPSLQQVIRYLDAHPEVVSLNQGISEKTGPMMFPPEVRARWKMQQAANSVEWLYDWRFLGMETPKNSEAVYCAKGTCYIGYKYPGENRIVTQNGSVITGRATLACACGTGREWYFRGK